MKDNDDSKKPFEIEKDDSKLDWDEILHDKAKSNTKEDKTKRIELEDIKKNIQESKTTETTINDEHDDFINNEKIEEDEELSKKNSKKAPLEDDKEVKKNVKKINKKKKSKKKKHKIIKRIFLTLFILMIIGVIAAAACVYAILKTDRWAITEDELLADSGAVVYDKDGNELVTLTGDEINKKVTLAEMGKLPDAFISIEDERFYSHKGIDVQRTAYAIFRYITSRISGKSASFGGSTITQQLVKITMKDTERSGIEGIQRKIREWSRAYQVEKMLNKNQILQRYLNIIYMATEEGLNIHGVESASIYFFNKSAKDLSIAESAFIAGINHSPNNYNVFNSKDDITERVKKRTITVLDKMLELEKINQEEYDAAKNEVNEGLKFEKGKVSNGSGDLTFHTSAAINQIAQELSDKKDISYDAAREQLISSGYSIYTTVDMNVQNQVKEIFEDPKYKINGAKIKSGDVDISGQSAICIIEPSTGYVIAEYGGLGKDQNTLGLNRGLTKRQGGSSFKPLGTVSPALENKVVTASTLFYDVRTTFGRNYNVRNDSSYHNYEHMRDILKHSCNVPEVKLLQIMGLDKSQEFLKKIGIEVNADSAGLSMALGTVDVSPLQMAAGYAMLANGGVYITPTFYTKVVDKNGNVIIEATQEKSRVMTEQNAYVETSMLQGPIGPGGTASAYAGMLGNMDVAGKTGTTSDAKDRWFCGYTPYYAAACWYGNDDNNSTFGMSNPASKVWFNTMKKIHSSLEAKKFTKPEGITTVSICKDTGRRATENCTDTYSEIFSNDSIPAACEGHEKLKICKETGKVATEFCTDTEEKVFGRIIDTERNANWSPKMEIEEAPAETCDVHTEAAKKDVPNVVGKKQADAVKILTDAGFKVKTEKGENINNPKGVVLKQSSTQASEGAEIVITINQVGEEATTTPSVTPSTSPSPKPTGSVTPSVTPSTTPATNETPIPSVT